MLNLVVDSLTFDVNVVFALISKLGHCSGLILQYGRCCGGTKMVRFLVSSSYGVLLSGPICTTVTDRVLSADGAIIDNVVLIWNSNNDEA